MSKNQNIKTAGGMAKRSAAMKGWAMPADFSEPRP